MKFALVVLFSVFLAACAPTTPKIRYAGENAIELVYSAYGSSPTLTGEAIDMAIEHCAKHGKGMKHVSSSAISEFTTQEIHTFMCTNDFVDERIEIDIKD